MIDTKVSSLFVRIRVYFLPCPRICISILTLSIFGGNLYGGFAGEHGGPSHRLARVFRERRDSQPRIMRDDSSSISRDQASRRRTLAHARASAFH